MKNKLILFVSSNLFIGAAFHMMYLKVNQNAYISIILGTLLGILNIYIFNKLKNKNNNNIFFKVLFILFNLYIILLTLTIIPLFVNYFYLVESPKWLILTPFLGVSMYIAYKGKNTLCKLSNLVFIINIFLILTTFLLLTGNFKLENILPILDTSSMNIFKTSIIYSSFSSIPIITKLTQTESLSPAALRMLNQTTFASDLYESVITDKFGGFFINEHQKQLIRI